MSGVPGSNGIPGIPGSPGSPGRDGSKGPVGAMGPKGSKGEVGEKGGSGTAGTKGAKGDAAKPDLQQRANWKQCVWRAYSSTDDGKIKVRKSYSFCLKLFCLTFVIEDKITILLKAF